MNKESLYRLLELILQWEGQFNSQRLMRLSSSSRQTVSKIVTSYRESFPNQLIYDGVRKVYVPSNGFSPQMSKASFYDYMKECFNGLQVGSFLSQTLTDPPPEIIRPLLKAIQTRQRIDIRYISLSSPDYDERIISPHALAFDGRRYHVRAWCEKNQDFRDFVLSRIHQIYTLEGTAVKCNQDDEKWHADVSFCIEPDPRLNEQQKRVIAIDYGMQKQADGRYQREYHTKVAMLLYLKQHLRVDIVRDNPLAQQVVLSPESEEKLASYSS